MRSRIRAVAVGLALLVGVSAAAEAQSRALHFGPRIGYNFDLEEFSIGAHLIKPLTSAIAFYPSFDYYMTDPGTIFGINADLRYQMPAQNLQWLYLGAGVGFTRFSFEGFSNTTTRLNLIGGFQPVGGGRIKPFAEARLGVGDGSTFGVFGGISIPLGN